MWKSVVDSKFAIWLGALISLEAVYFTCRGSLLQGGIDVMRTGIYTKMTVDGMRRGNDAIKKSKVQKQYNEVADEIENL